MLLQILIILFCVLTLFFIFKKNRKEKIKSIKENVGNEEQYVDEGEDDELVSNWYSSKEDLEYYDDYEKAVLIGMGTLINKYDTFSHSFISTEEDVRKNTDYEFILIPYQKINMLFDTSSQIFEDLGFEHRLILSELTTIKSGFTEFDLINEVCRFYRTNDKEKDLENCIIEAIEVFKSIDNKITITFSTGS